MGQAGGRCSEVSQTLGPPVCLESQSPWNYGASSRLAGGILDPKKRTIRLALGRGERCPHFSLRGNSQEGLFFIQN